MENQWNKTHNEGHVIAIVGTEQGLIKGSDEPFSSICSIQFLDIGQQAWDNNRPIAKGQ